MQAILVALLLSACAAEIIVPSACPNGGQPSAGGPRGGPVPDPCNPSSPMNLQPECDKDRDELRMPSGAFNICRKCELVQIQTLGLGQSWQLATWHDTNTSGVTYPYIFYCTGRRDAGCVAVPSPGSATECTSTTVTGSGE